MDKLKNNLGIETTSFFSQDAILAFGTKLFLAVLILIIGWWIIKKIIHKLRRILGRSIDESTLSFTMPMVGVLLKFVLLLGVAGYLGIETTSFVAMLAALGFAVGMAMSGVLQDFAGGILIVVLRPFKVDHFIKVQGEAGLVKEIHLFTTKLHTPDNREIIIPNRGITSTNLINYSALEQRRVDFVFGISYDDDFRKAIQIIKDIAENHDKVLKDMPVFARVSELGDSAVNITTRVWTMKEHYWDVYFDLLEMVKETFDREGITIPYPQRDVHLKNYSKDI